MKADRKKKPKEESPLTKPGTASRLPRHHFNISHDSLKCFKRSSKSAKAPKCKGSFSKITSKPDVSKPRQEEAEQKKKESRQDKIEGHSPDLSRDVSNEILQRIQAQGILCNWEEEMVIEPSQQEQQQDKRIWKSFSQQFSCKSYASTVDMYNYRYHNVLSNPSLSSNMSLCNLYDSQYTLLKSKTYDPNVFEIDLMAIDNDPRTTIMIRNVPNKYSIQDLSAEIDAVLENTYDFLYLPCDLRNQCNVGYGFINLVDTCYLRDFYRQFHCKKWLKFRSEKICVLTYARLQGLESLIEHFQNSKVLNQKDKKYRPIIREMDKIQHLIRKQQGDLSYPSNARP